MRAQFVFHEVWIGLRRNLTMTIALVVVVAISLSLLGTGLLFVKQVSNTRTYWQGKVQLSVYLCSKSSVSSQCAKNGPVTAAQLANINQLLKSNPDVSRSPT
jgi:cell division transport system permease protein